MNGGAAEVTENGGCVLIIKGAGSHKYQEKAVRRPIIMEYIRPQSRAALSFYGIYHSLINKGNDET
jgi:hypothetical protein